MKSLAELRAIRERMEKQIDLRDSGDDRIRVVVGMAPIVSEHLVNGRVVEEYTIGAAE